MKNKQLAINMIASIVTFAINLGISFFLAPFIINKLGRESYGFIGLINNFVSYASIVTIALNSMADRYITLKIHQNDEKGARIYFNSVLIGNLIMAGVFAIIALIMMLNLGSLINIPGNLNKDVRIAFSLVALEFIISLVTSVFAAATFIKNKLYLASIRSIESNFLRVVIIVILFVFLPAKIFYINIASLGAAILVVITNIYFTIKLIPELKIDIHYFRVSAVVELIKSGMWNVFTRLSQILETGLDLLLANIFLGASIMGTLSISKTIPTTFVSFTVVMVSVFAPQLTISYAKNEISDVIKGTKQSIKIMTFLTSLFFAFIVIYSKDFYELWIPSQDAKTLYILTILAVFHMPISSGMNSLFNIFTITNKIKKSSLVFIGCSIVNVIIIVIVSNILTANYAMYFIAGTSSLLDIFVSIFFVVPYAGICLNKKKSIFYSDLLLCVIGNILIVVTFSVVKLVFPVTGWITLFISIFISGILGSAVNMYILMKKEERIFFVNKILRRKKQ